MPYTYRGTPQEKIEEARERIGEATATTALASYLAPAENTVDQPVAQPITQEESEPSLGKRIGDSIGDIAHQVFKGVMSFTEGLEDFAAYGIAKMAQLAGNEKLAQDAIDFANVSQTEEYDKMLADAGLGYEGSIYKELDAKSQRIIYGIFQGVGQMAPMVVGGYIGAAAKGAAATSSGVKAAQVVGKAAEWANLGMLGASAAGNATQSAMNDTEIYDEYGNVIKHREVNFDKAIAYGLASGAVEIATEKLVGGIFEKATGKGVLDPLIKRLGTSTAWRKVAQFGLNALGEGFEEVASEAVAKTLQTIYTSEDGKPHWENPDVQDMFEAGVIGTLSSALLGAGQGAVTRLSPKQYVQEKIADINESSKRADIVAGDGKMDEKRQNQYIREQNANLRALANSYNRASEKTQNKLWEAYGAELGQYINKDGTRKETSLNEGVKPIGATAVTAGALSPSLMMRANEIANVVAREGGSVAVELNEDEQRNTRELQTVLRGVGTESGASLKMAVVEGLPAGRKAFLSGDVMYVSRDVVGDVATVARKFFHEDAHFARGSNAYKTEVAVMSALAMQEGTATRAAFLRAIDDVRAATVQEGTQGGYNIDGAILGKIESGEILLGDESLASVPAEQRSEAELAVDEVVARMFEYTYGHKDNAFGEELFHALATDNRGTAQKWLQRIKRTIKRAEAWVKTKQGTEAERAEAQKVLDGLDTLRSAQKRMTDILAESGQKYNTQRAAVGLHDDNHYRYSIDNDELQETVETNQNASLNTADDTRYTLRSKTDSEGRTLTPEQQEFFKDSKVVDEHGNLLVVYHGTRDDFTIFDRSKTGRSNDLAKVGFWFTTSKDGAVNFSQSTWYGDSPDAHAVKSYIDIKNPKIYRTQEVDQARIDALWKEARPLRERLHEIWQNIDINGMGYSAILAFQRLVEGKTIDPSTYRLSNENYERLKDDAAEYSNAQERVKAIENEIVELSYLDAYEQFRTDIYKYMGMNAEDANVNGTGKAWYKDGSFQDKGPMIEKYRDDLIKSGYDGIFIVGTKYDAKTMGEDNTQYVAFDSNQIKLTTNENPTSNPDIRYSIDTDDDGPTRHSPSVSKYKTERQARVDNLLRETGTRRLYTSVDAAAIIKEVEGVMVLDDGNIIGKIAPSQRKYVMATILDTLRNAPEGGRISRCLLAADYILATAIGEDVRLDPEDDPTWQHKKEIIAIGRVIKNATAIRIGEHEKGELIHRFDKKGYARIKRMWLVESGSQKKVYKKENGQRVAHNTECVAFDTAWEELAEARPDIFDKEKLPLDGWMDFFEEYDAAVTSVKQGQEAILYREYGSKADYAEQRKKIANIIFDSFYKKGMPDQDIERAVAYLYDDAEYYKRLAKDAQMRAAMANTATAEMSKKLRTATAEARRFARLVAKAEAEATSLSAFTKEQQGKTSRIVGYHSAAVLTNEAVARGIERLANNAKRSVTAPSTREAIVEFGKFYTKDNQLLSNVFDQQVRDDMDFIIGKHNMGLTADNVPLSEEEVQSVYNVMRHIRYLAERIDRYRGRGGQFESIPSAAGEIIDGIQKVEAYHRRNGKGLMRALRWFRDKVSDPRVIIRDLVGYDNNSKLLELFDALTDGETRAHKMEASMYRILEDFRKNNKAYMKSLDNTTVKIGDAELTKGEAMQIALLWMQPYSRKTLESSGFWTTNKDGTRKKHRALTLEDMMAFVQTFSKADQDFIDTALKVYSYAKQAHIEADIGIKGFSEIDTDSDSIYVHVQVAEESLPTTAENKQGFNVSAANLGIAKSRTGAHLALNVKNALGALLEYIPQEAKYCFLAVPAKNFELVYNYNVNRTLDANKQSASNTYDIRTVKSTLAGIYSTADKYLSDMLQDGQGFTERESGELARWAQKVYSRFVTAGLGLNVKVMITQFASYPAAGIYISPKNLAKAMFVHYERGMFADMDNFSDWAYSRNAEGGAALAAAALGEDRLDAILQKTTAGINAIDRFTIGRLWIACQYEVESKKGLAFGTDANKRAAAKLLEEVGRATQPNYTAFERSALQRSNNIFAIAFKPFTSVATKYCSRLFEAVGEFRAIGFLKSQGVQLSAAQIRARKTNVLRVAASLATANMMYALMVEFMKHILNRDLKDKDGNEIGFVQDLLQEFASASISMFPIVRDIVDKLCFGYDIDDYATSALNDVVDSVTAMGSLLDQAMQGENVDSHKLSRTLKQSLLSIATFTGVPARNAYNLVYGLTKRFDETAAARWDDTFYATSIADVNKAITKGDDRKAEALVDLVIDQRIEGLSADVNKKLYELYKQYASGENVDLINCLPKAVNKTFNYNNETITMNAKELKQFRATYNKASEAIEALIAQDVFDGLKAEEQAQAIKTITDYYYYKAQYDVMEMEYDCSKHKVLLFADTMDTDVFALAVGSCKYIEGRKNKAGQTIAGSKEAAIKKWLKQLPLSRMEKIILLAYLGYSVKDYAPLLRKYAASLGWSKAQQTSFLKACGVV